MLMLGVESMSRYEKANNNNNNHNENKKSPMMSSSTKSLHTQLAIELLDTCIHTYTHTSTGLAPEISLFDKQIDNVIHDFIVDPHAHHNLLRPETVESLMILYRFTKNKKYQDIGWNIFLMFVKYCRIDDGGYSGLRDVRVNDRQDKQMWQNWNDKQEVSYILMNYRNIKT